MKRILFILFSLLISYNAIGQNLTKNKKAKKYFEKAYNYYLAGDIENSALFCSKSSKKDPLYTEPYVLKAQIFSESKKYQQAIDLLKKVLSISPNYTPVYFIIAKYLMSNESYKEAVIYLKKYISQEKNKAFVKQAQRLIKISEFRANQLKNPIHFKPIRLTNKINTRESEYFPTISADNNSIIFTRLIGNKRHRQEDIFVYNRKQQKTTKISDLINTPYNEGANTISLDGKIMIFARCSPQNGCNLFVSIKTKTGKWAKPVKLPAPVNSRYWDSQPSLSPDGKELYFVSNRPGGKGKMDIWSSKFLGNAHWSKPLNLGDSINTPGNEMSPFIHFDNKTLYFSSDYLIGMGKFDIFKSTKINDTTWTKPLNLGYPLNTKENEYRLIVTPAGDTAYFSSERDTAFKQDIYSFVLDSNIRPERTLFLKVNIYKDSGIQKTKADKISLIDLDNFDTVFSAQNRAFFLTCLPIKDDYALNILKKGYLFYSHNFSLKKIPDSLRYFTINVFLKPIIEKSKFVLKNTFFQTDSYQIRPKSFVELNNLAEFLKINSSLNIQINGHTDNVGTFDYNMILSEKRALEIKKYLLQKGIEKNRMKCKGYGYTRPQANNNTEKGRKQNRRTEIIILKK